MFIFHNCDEKIYHSVYNIIIINTVLVRVFISLSVLISWRCVNHQLLIGGKSDLSIQFLSHFTRVVEKTKQ